MIDQVLTLLAQAELPFGQAAPQGSEFAWWMFIVYALLIIAAADRLGCW